MDIVHLNFYANNSIYDKANTKSKTDHTDKLPDPANVLEIYHKLIIR